MRWRTNELSLGMATLALSLCWGCSGADGPSEPTTSFPADPYAILTSEQGKLTIEVRTGPSQPPGRGKTDVQFIVRDEVGALLDGLDVEATPWMPVMGHGTSVMPMASGDGAGKYSLRNVSMYMPGLWELRTRFSGIVMDTATPVFDVP